jgi:replicative DNA helicase
MVKGRKSWAGNFYEFLETWVKERTGMLHCTFTTIACCRNAVLEKRPLLTWPSWIGAIEQDADIVSFICPEYKIDEWDDDEAIVTAGQAEFIIAKNIEMVKNANSKLVIW